ncbi:MAG TPA: EF-hand domain-containing protein [Novosphingobium sp.]|nr:EF-hand domain-containing protein [Novosphingobium sp.]
MYRIILGALALVAAPVAHAQAGWQRGDMLEAADANGDGLVSREEYRASRGAKFARLDRNGDGAVSRDDFARLAERRPDAAQKLELLVTEADANKDGKVTRAEYDAMPTPIFDKADTNGDGNLDKTEMAAARAKMEAMKPAR